MKKLLTLAELSEKSKEPVTSSSDKTYEEASV